MVGRMAMNNTWEIAKIDAAFFDENLDDRPTREEIIRLYADFAQREHDALVEKGDRIANRSMVVPLLNLFAGEWKGAQFRKQLNVWACLPKYAGKIKELILDALEFYRSVNPLALTTRNGEKTTCLAPAPNKTPIIIKESWIVNCDAFSL